MMKRCLLLSLTVELVLSVILYITYESMCGGQAPWEWDEENWAFAIAAYLVFILPILLVIMLITGLFYWYLSKKRLPDH